MSLQMERSGVRNPHQDTEQQGTDFSPFLQQGVAMTCMTMSGRGRPRRDAKG